MIEMLLTISLFGMVVGTIGLVARSGSTAYQSSSINSFLVQQARRALREATDVLLTSRLDSLQTFPLGPLWQDEVDLDRLVSIAADGEVTWEAIRLRFRYEDGEMDDGIDNNGNGVADEGVLELVTDWGGPGERTRVLTHWVREFREGEEDDGNDNNGNQLRDEHGFCIERSGDIWVLRLTLERLDSNGVLVTETAETSLQPRN